MPRSVLKVEKCLLGDLHLMSPETQKVGRLSSTIKRPVVGLGWVNRKRQTLKSVFPRSGSSFLRCLLGFESLHATRKAAAFSLYSFGTIHAISDLCRYI